LGREEKIQRKLTGSRNASPKRIRNLGFRDPHDKRDLGGAEIEVGGG